MHNHYDKNLNLKKWIFERRPKTIVECGVGRGDLTRQIASLLDVYDFEFYAVSDNAIENIHNQIVWKSGLSYDVLKTFGNDSIDLCIIDTDHNFWTLMKEFEAMFYKISEGGLIALHDVETFYHDTGMALSYHNGKAYPKDEIEKFAPYGSLGDAMIEFLQAKKMHYKLLAYNHESNGAALLERKTQSMFSVVVPGPGAIYSKREKEVQKNAGIPVG